jgi:hypothetical protein
MPGEGNDQSVGVGRRFDGSFCPAFGAREMVGRWGNGSMGEEEQGVVKRV